jgi:serine/threonine-protein kinase
LGTTLEGGFVLRRFLGAGGMGSVYEAVAPDGLRVAVKVLLLSSLAGDDGEANRARFEREASVAAALETPHVLPLIHTGVDHALGAPFLVMPLLVGSDLKQVMTRVGPLHPAVAARIGRQACWALIAAHEGDIVHRDVKPSNIYLSQDEQGSVVVKLLDFGIAKFAGEDAKLTQTGTLLGTPAYMAPEQARSVSEVDPRADVWSMGVVLYQALTGTRPFPRAKSLADLFLAICSERIPPLQDAAPWVHPGLAALVHGALIRPLEDRCPSARALADELEAHTGGTDELTAAMLAAPEPVLFDHHAARATLPKSWGTLQSQSEQVEVDSPLLTRTRDPLLGAVVAKRYTLLRCLGSGGVGAVYEARDLDENRYAIKILDPRSGSRDREARARFVREAQAAASLTSQHVVRIHETGTDDELGVPFIVMELLHGVDLGLRLERFGPLAPHTAARLFTQACEALGEAHERSLAHRDVKPSNLFLQYLPAGEVLVKVCDFGLVKRIDAEEDDAPGMKVTRTGHVVGSPAYMSPEQLKDAHGVDHRADIWSLGVALYEALAGRHPWHGRSSLSELILAICTEPLPHLQDEASWVPAGLAAVVHEALRRRPDDRFASMHAFARALAPFTGDELLVDAADLLPLPTEARAAAAPRAPDPSRPPLDLAGADEPGDRSNEPAPGRSRSVGIALFALLGVGAVGATMVFTSSDSTTAVGPPQGDSPPSSALASESPPRKLSVAIAIEPSTATVSVDGVEQALREGKLELQAEVGQRFVVALREGDRFLERTVIVSRDGSAEPPRLALPAADPSPPAGDSSGPLPGIAAPDAQRPTPPRPTPSTGPPTSTGQSPKPKGKFDLGGRR